MNTTTNQTSNVRKYVIGRPINDISINGLEYVTDDNGEEMIFDSIEDDVV